MNNNIERQVELAKVSSKDSLEIYDGCHLRAKLQDLNSEHLCDIIDEASQKGVSIDLEIASRAKRQAIDQILRPTFQAYGEVWQRVVDPRRPISLEAGGQPLDLGEMECLEAMEEAYNIVEVGHQNTIWEGTDGSKVVASQASEYISKVYFAPWENIMKPTKSNHNLVL